MNKNRMAQILIPVLALVMLLPQVTAAVALLTGLGIALTFGNPYPTKNYIHLLLGISVAGLGAGMNLETVALAGAQGFAATFFSIAAVFTLGMFLKHLLKVEEQIGILVSVGTAICGGSAIAAVTPVIRAKPQAVSVALGTVFILNALALLIFPSIGHYFEMSEQAFGLWSALAIHDTSSVVGATVAYGPSASEIGTTVKLARALWIVPVTLLIGYLYKPSAVEHGAPQSNTKKPWFILWFIIAAAVVTWIPSLQPAGQFVETIARRLLVLTLFFIGLGLSKETLKSVGVKPFLLGCSLWLITSVVSLIAILKLNFYN
ncbi:MAG: rane protein [Pseudobdellovibrio sp.]|jgi:uncharacterized integral membrane protein (TIGR00698 family)|nr:rane protein [Pseudobdellovibrio sp.]